MRTPQGTVRAYFIGLFVLTTLACSAAQAQQTFVGANVSLVPLTRFPVLGIQGGVFLDERFSLRGAFETDFDTALYKAELLYVFTARAFTTRAPTVTAPAWRGYLGGGVTAARSRDLLTGAYGFIPLPGVTGGLEYLMGDI